MTSEEYIIKLLHTIESLNFLVRDLRGEVAFIHDELPISGKRMRTRPKRLMGMIKAKDGDIKKLTDKMTDLLDKVDTLTVALEDKSHQLTTRNRGQFGTNAYTKSARIVDNNYETSGFIPEEIMLKNIKKTKLIGFR